MATTTNFGWETPDDTDLVKDGALAIRTLGSAIDTSLVDLKGGTTGQVLSKTSNTDMDFTWVTSDDANAIQNTIVDAKGDLITATAADVPARLAVSVSNTAFLRADSGESTGLKWDNDAWTAYTPTWTNLTVGNATQTFRYKQIGKTVFVTGLITLGSTSSITGLIDFTNPVSATSTNLQTVRTDVLLYRGGFNIGVLYPNGATKWYIRALNTAGTYGGTTDTSATVPGTWTTGDFIAVSYTYEAA